MSPEVQHAIYSAAGALLVAVLNELRAEIRARQARRERADHMTAVEAALTGGNTHDEHEAPAHADDPGH